ncbi:NADH:flavorubredoxin reductase NorW [Vibrio ponticus]|uniref:NADH:flavorubredoxin reductase NorW n=1 Tax=Vibrio ponticus TaxID=265668 RepID=A0A3N3E608_9VIBR|nr:NADH:flavorubredoxin reductase NorW [Vibrio ponticus]ROV62175.1 NADH:flavorubredoxin reductase NorW [Vibrio ponticus]
MKAPIVIIGSGFAAYQLVKSVRRLDASSPIQVFTADDGAEYNKPDLSHVFSKQQTARDLVVKTAQEFAQQHNIELFSHSLVERVDTQTQQIVVNGCTYPYAKLVFATGAQAFVPPMLGDAVQEVFTLNSLQEYQAVEARLSDAKRVLVIGGGLIGVELAMDLASSGKEVSIVEPNTRLLANLLPEFVALPLEHHLIQQGIKLLLSSSVSEVNYANGSKVVTLSNGHTIATDAVICAAGLRANTTLAREAGIAINQGICVNSQLQTSVTNVYALGDCAEIEGKVLPYLQPIVLSANVLAKQLLGEEARLVLPPMMVKVKTPSYPIQLAGSFAQVETWSVQFSKGGIVAKAENANNQLTGFVVSGEQVTQAFPLLRELSTSASTS